MQLVVTNYYTILHCIYLAKFKLNVKYNSYWYMEYQDTYCWVSVKYCTVLHDRPPITLTTTCIKGYTCETMLKFHIQVQT